MAVRGSMIKDPDAVLDFVWDWRQNTNRSTGTDWLASGETIASATVSVVSGDVVVDSSGLTDSSSSVTAWLSGGTDGTDAEVRCRIITSDSRTDDRTLILKVRNR